MTVTIVSKRDVDSDYSVKERLTVTIVSKRDVDSNYSVKERY